MGDRLVNIGAILTLDNITYLAYGAAMSLCIALVAVLGGIIIGTLVAILKLAKSSVLKIIGNIYVEIVRGTPMLLQILFFYLGIPVLYQLMFNDNLRVNIYACGILAMALNSGAYCAELIRSGIEGIDPGQKEAGKTLNLSEKTIMVKIILPQAIRRIIPPLVSEFITLIKDSSLLGTIGVMELLNRAKIIGTNYYNYLIPLLVASAFYLIMTLFISYISRNLERRLAIYDRS